MYRALEDLECRLDNIIYRSMLAHSVYEARRLCSFYSVVVNGKKMRNPDYRVNEGDVIQIIQKNQERHFNKTYGSPYYKLNAFIPPNLEVNFRNMSIFVVYKPKFDELPQPYDRQVIESAINYYNHIY
ncbi:alpha-L RNA-binding motif-containing protein [Rozella allomycis CSF55]|uniref:Alpha-L RNA-binding motif-containing protein n=1 Tax=Rozella allomycis (strain CSF55) TaxID=988480 RepID=A0A075B2C6_ROZAC|nr:hypothetical protein O9G_006109 [Rozella allomycis CSF55]RKP18648.1 alpha-L RNA-binding motif-containing protein [Rozella allomycis CSF55]|eukprot:EPZ36692.1 hypothetical protein O9G_006109 [Rozella allomycis CSF55]